jgi:hypothetical protein
MCEDVCERRQVFFSTYDMKAFFYQFGLAPAVSMCFPFRVGNDFYVCQRLPMGVKFAPSIAQCVLYHLVSCVISEMGDMCDIVCDLYIDNIFVCSNFPSQLNRFHFLFKKMCDKYSVTIGDSNVCSSRVTHRGICFDASELQFSLSSTFLLKFGVKLRDWRLVTAPSPIVADLDLSLLCLSLLKSRDAEWRSMLTNRDTLSSFVGSVVYAMVARGDALAGAFTLLRLLAIAVTNVSKLSTAVTPACIRVARSLSHAILTNKPRNLRDWPHQEHVVVTDASTGSRSGGLVWVTPDGRVQTMTVEVSDSHINVREAEVLVAAVERVARSHPGSLIHVVCDNTAVISALAAGHSHSWVLNHHVDRVARIARTHHCVLQPWWVPSALNPADGLSRARAFSPEDLRLTRSLVRRVAAVAPVPRSSYPPLVPRSSLRVLRPGVRRSVGPVSRSSFPSPTPSVSRLLSSSTPSASSSSAMGMEGVVPVGDHIFFY